MRLLITGICGFVGSTLARTIREERADVSIFGIDNLIRRGSEGNLIAMEKMGVAVFHGDLRSQSDVDVLPDFDWVIDAAANPSVLAGADGKTSSRQLMEHNLIGTIHLLERCKSLNAGFTLLSTSRVYSIPPLANLPVSVVDGAFVPREEAGALRYGIDETFSTAAPVSLYGASKLASEALALEYGETFGFPVWINRCGVLAGAGQFGKADQGIFSFWIRAHRARQPLKYIGFDGMGHQVRDCLQPRDLVPLLLKQIEARGSELAANAPKIINVSGGLESAMSLRQLTAWCDDRFGCHAVGSEAMPRPFDLPWVVLKSKLAKEVWGWTPRMTRDVILDEIANSLSLTK